MRCCGHLGKWLCANGKFVTLSSTGVTSHQIKSNQKAQTWPPTYQQTHKVYYKSFKAVQSIFVDEWSFDQSNKL